MKTSHFLIAWFVLIGISVVAVCTAGGMPGQASANTNSNFPKDVYPETGNRLPAIQRADLDDAGKKLIDARPQPDFFGPGAIRLYSPPVADSMSTVNDYLRHKSGLEARYVELAILVTAREWDCEYVWTAHEGAGLKAGLSQATINTVKYRKSVEGLDEKEAALIQLGRQAVGKHHVDSATASRAISLFGKAGVVNLVSLLGDYSSTAVLLNAFDQHIRPADKPLLPIP